MEGEDAETQESIIVKDDLNERASPLVLKQYGKVASKDPGIGAVPVHQGLIRR